LWNFFGTFFIMTPPRDRHIRRQVSISLIRHSPPPNTCSASTGRELEQEFCGHNKKILFVPYVDEARTLSVHIISFSTDTSKTQATTCPSTPHWNCSREHCFDLTSLLTFAYAVRLVDVTNLVFHCTWTWISAFSAVRWVITSWRQLINITPLPISPVSMPHRNVPCQRLCAAYTNKHVE
jgi:hypothetical protein